MPEYLINKKYKIRYKGKIITAEYIGECDCGCESLVFSRDKSSLYSSDNKIDIIGLAFNEEVF